MPEGDIMPFLKRCRGLMHVRTLHMVRKEVELREMLFGNQSEMKIETWRKNLEELWRQRTVATGREQQS